jgi:hopene-associated glycosyltransferase HpnB
MTILAACALLAWAYLLLGHGRFWSAGPVLAPARPAAAPPVDVVVPARDEAASIAATLKSLLAQDYPGPLRVILVDDGSTDGTGDIARQLVPSPSGRGLGEGGASGTALTPTLSRGERELVVVSGASRPPGWSGKLWAVQQGVERAGAGLILLTDADIVHDPAHLSTLVVKAEADRLDLVSEMVELRAVSLAERALVPAFVFFFQLLYPFARVNDARSRAAAAAGGTMLVRRSALDRIGGIASLRGALIDDVTLAARIKPGGRIYLGHSQLARSLRPYPHPADIWRMVARTAYVQLRFSPLLLLGTVLGLALIWLLPPGLALFGSGAARLMGAVAWAGSALSYLPTLRRFGQSPLWSLALPAIAGFYMAATLGAALDHHRGRGVVWKRRAYRDASA